MLFNNSSNSDNLLPIILFFYLLLTFKECGFPRDMKSILTRSLFKSYDGINAVDGVDLDVDEGQIFWFFWDQNGAGKSTVIKLLTTLIQPTSGKISVLEIDPIKEPLNIRKRIGVVFTATKLRTYTISRKISGKIWNDVEP